METLTRLPQCPSPPLEALSLQYSRAGVSTSLRVPLARSGSGTACWLLSLVSLLLLRSHTCKGMCVQEVLWMGCELCQVQCLCSEGGHSNACGRRVTL